MGDTIIDRRKFCHLIGEDVLIFRRDTRRKVTAVTLQSTGAELAKVR